MRSIYFVLAGTLVFNMPANSADATAVGVTAGVPQACTGVVKGQTFFSSSFDFYYAGGQVILASGADGTGSISVEEKLAILVYPPGGGSNRWSYLFPSQGWQLDPVDLQKKFRPGLNKVSVTLSAIRGGCVSSTPIWLSNQPLAQ